VKLNREGYEDIADVLERGRTALAPRAFEVAVNETGALVLDVRRQEEFAKGHIPRSVFIGLNGDFAPWVGALIADVKQPILLVTPEGKIEETVTRLSRVGFDGTLGYLKGGFEAWKAAGMEYDTVTSISAAEAGKALETEKAPVFDVRKSSEYEVEHLVDANNTPLGLLNEHLAEFPKEQDFYLHCAGGYRSMIAASILKSRGYHNLINVAGGFAAMKESGMDVTDHACPSGSK
jgi:rhodanese-related sulfurtransferase